MSFVTTHSVGGIGPGVDHKLPVRLVARRGPRRGAGPGWPRATMIRPRTPPMRVARPARAGGAARHMRHRGQSVISTPASSSDHPPYAVMAPRCPGAGRSTGPRRHGQAEQEQDDCQGAAVAELCRFGSSALNIAMTIVLEALIGTAAGHHPDDLEQLERAIIDRNTDPDGHGPRAT